MFPAHGISYNVLFFSGEFARLNLTYETGIFCREMCLDAKPIEYTFTAFLISHWFLISREIVSVYCVGCCVYWLLVAGAAANTVSKRWKHEYKYDISMLWQISPMCLRKEMLSDFSFVHQFWNVPSQKKLLNILQYTGVVDVMLIKHRHATLCKLTSPWYIVKGSCISFCDEKTKRDRCVHPWFSVK